MAPRLAPLAWLLPAARRRGWLQALAVGVTPSLNRRSMAAVLLTVAACYRAWSRGPRLPGVVFPAVSELGVDLPQRRMYQFGFVSCGALLSASVAIFTELLAPHLLQAAAEPIPGEDLGAGGQARICGLGGGALDLNGQVGKLKTQEGSGGRWRVELPSGAVKAVPPQNLVAHKPEAAAGAPERQLWDSCLRWAHCSALGVAVQGGVTLVRELCLQNFVHWGGAVLFMAGAVQHAKASVDLYEAAARRGAPLLGRRRVAVAARARHAILNYSSMALFLLPLALQAFPAAGPPGRGTTAGGGASPEVDPAVLNAMGVVQWGIIQPFAVFFCTYACDMSAAAAWRPPEG
ncbi:unnamed protein product [Prorocentrum cordatum]|uniref:Uncharacterized protein n=2 Tax=Prorocentrum cordatum TaxID=2364126 RepID=A0ABN9SUS8_9DINO|nr:unnamed protein product [Polarella glacialis]